MRRTYKFLLLLYPRGHRDRFAEEMTGVFEEASAERRAEGWTWYIRFSFAEMTGLIAGATEAWLAPKHAPEAPAAHSSYLPQELIQAQQRVDANIAGMVHAIANHQFERARILSNQEREARENLRILREKYSDEYGMPS
ncbi:MAG: hypothetical protein ABSG13_07930 [Bryobacteraceae bacterium]|jgi:hypothetical protein